MAAILNPNAPLFVPSAATAAAGDELSVIYHTCRFPSPLQQYDNSYFNKGVVFLQPSLIYYHSPLSIVPNFSYYVPPPKYAIPTVIESEAAEVSGSLPRLGHELGGEDEQILPAEMDVEEQSIRNVTSSRFAIKRLRGQYGCRQLIKRSSQLWIRKSSLSKVKLPQDANFALPEGLQSTVMIKNIPNKLSRRDVLDLLDQHCRMENQKIKEDGVDTALSEFDFLYLPMDFMSGNNLGYAFVNFTSSVAAKRLYENMHMMSWNSFGSRKICEITHAKIQGFEELVKHFRRSVFTCSSAEYLPVYFQPSRDGSRSCAELLVGKLVQRSISC